MLKTQKKLLVKEVTKVRSGTGGGGDESESTTPDDVSGIYPKHGQLIVGKTECSHFWLVAEKVILWCVL